MRLLIDMDGVLADFEQGLADIWRERHPERPPIVPAERTVFKVSHQFPQWRDDLHAIYTTPDFFLGLPPVKGAVEGMRKLRTEHDVWICTAPLRAWRHCVAEKFEWVDRHLGGDWTHRMIMTRDKALIVGDRLLDDNPLVPISTVPTWEHVVFDAPYNRTATNVKRMAGWRDLHALISA